MESKCENLLKENSLSNRQMCFDWFEIAFYRCLNLAFSCDTSNEVWKYIRVLFSRIFRHSGENMKQLVANHELYHVAPFNLSRSDCRQLFIDIYGNCMQNQCSSQGNVIVGNVKHLLADNAFMSVLAAFSILVCFFIAKLFKKLSMKTILKQQTIAVQVSLCTQVDNVKPLVKEVAVQTQDVRNAPEALLDEEFPKHLDKTLEEECKELKFQSSVGNCFRVPSKIQEKKLTLENSSKIFKTQSLQSMNSKLKRPRTFDCKPAWKI